MTAHGAYTQLKASARRVKDVAGEAKSNVTALYAAGELPEDPELIAELAAMTEAFRSLEAAVAAARDRTFDVADRYLTANTDKVMKDYKLTGHGQQKEGGRGR